MLMGPGLDTGTHDHTAFGVDGLCGDIYEWMRGMRLMDGKLEKNVWTWTTFGPSPTAMLAFAPLITRNEKLNNCKLKGGW